MAQPRTTALAASLLLIALLAGGVWWVFQQEPDDLPEPPAVATPESPGEAGPAPAETDDPEPELQLRTVSEDVEVFRRAFWRNPTVEDKVLHAERREWVAEEDGVRHWQWFLAVEPSPQLARYLVEKNPFAMKRVAAEEVELPRETPPPPWFPPRGQWGEMQIQRSQRSLMTWLRDPRTGVLYAFDTGGGFARPAAAEAVPDGSLEEKSRRSLAPRREPR